MEPSCHPLQTLKFIHKYGVPSTLEFTSRRSAALNPVFGGPNPKVLNPATGQNYHPGLLRADVEADQRRQKRLEGRTGGDMEDGPTGRQASKWEPATDPSTGQHADGSFSQAGDDRMPVLSGRSISIQPCSRLCHYLEIRI